jgi:hypothetical protein
MTTKYIKLTAQDNIHNNFIYKEGLNADPIPLNNKECEAGGLYFTDIDNWTKWIYYNDKSMHWIWDCKPVGDIVSFENKYKAQSIILSNPRCIWEDKDLQLEAVKQDGLSIQYIKNPSKAVQLEAVKENGDAIDFIKNPIEEVQLEAVKQKGYAIEFISNPSEEVQLEAFKKNSRSIQYISNPSKVVLKEAVKKYGHTIVQFLCKTIQID